MKLILLAMVLFSLVPNLGGELLFPVTAELCLLPQKNQPQSAGFLFLNLFLAPLIAHLHPRRPASPRSLLLTLFTQTPSSL